ncbi:methylmalonyl Co-A mutase-associated GTPase MeaB [Microaerobacter geothermalis]|uniref:methylmalonyl Co-A mutase-associated GTPase MeaB n=1 Tax=Microaerobacter geothermalis TaxID=674972 RepID=UPI001F2032D5|nr:methylmalonyl Co-A mutase-associated GTPase MeaB [Microaerobacter geothermalis]
MHPLAEQVVKGEARAMARAITYIENDHNEKAELLKALYPHTGNAYLLGITGSPGAGKSSLVDQLVSHLRQLGYTVGIIAVDPTSPFTGGALLGDRVRMQTHAVDPEVFIRSMGTRGSLGGLSRTTKEAVRVLDAAGKDVIIIETVGVGQSELDVMNIADTTAVVLTPGAGDQVQAFKAGIMEIADLFVINKGDLEGADKLKAQVEGMLDVVKHDAPWRPPVIKTVSIRSEGIDQLWASFALHQKFLKETGEWARRRKSHLRSEVLEIIHYRLEKLVNDLLKTGQYDHLLTRVSNRDEDPYSAAQYLLKEIFISREGGKNE